MELRQLRYFVAVANAGTISAAARRLHVVQSAVSHQVAALEEELGAQLLIRSKAGVALTAAGQSLYRHALAIVKHAEAASQDVRLADQEIRGRVSVGIPNSTAAVLAVALLKAARTELPHVQLTIVEGLSGVLAEQLASGRLDLSILFDARPLRGFRHLPLVAERLHFVSSHAAPGSASPAGRGIALRDVLKRPLILPPSPNGIRALIEGAAAHAGLTPIVVADVTGIATMLAAVKEGVADTVMMAVNAVGDGLRVQPIRAPAIERQASLVEPDPFAMSTAAGAVRDLLLREVAAVLARGRWLGARALAPEPDAAVRSP